MTNSVQIEKYDTERPSIVTIGTFDGVHVGHQVIIKRLVDESIEKGLTSILLTFFPHPRMVLQQDASIKLINTIEERSELLKRIGIDSIVLQPFTKEFSRLSAMEFVRDILVNTLKAKKVIVGYDHRFGRNRTASIAELIEFGQTFGFEVAQIPPQEINDVSVSSTKIRNALHEGDVKMANSYLGYHFGLAGNVVRGRALGRTIGFPTANISIQQDYKLVPKDGVYVVESNIDGRVVYGMMNIGTKPTVEGNERTIEVHFFDFEDDLYGRELSISLLHRLRDEQNFKYVDRLREQLVLDREQALAFIESYAR